MTDYAGKILTMESFTAQTTDGSAELDLTLQDTPSDDNNIYIFCGTSGYVAQFLSRTAKVVTVVVRKLVYDKIDDPVTGNLSNLPASVSEQSTQQTLTFATHSSTVATDDGARAAVGAHAHTATSDFMYQHDHSPGFTETALPLATSQGGLSITIAYVFE